ncbi:MAG TPA: phosphoribosyl-AMP cyclohydrolase, partial [Acidimicrobiales bacterium]|nr:phosphoribosyl-AMP cyclohydrolase [Acidimicrobiales bacterium]
MSVVGVPTATPAATPIRVDDADLAAVTFDAGGLVPAIVQEQATGAVLMMAWMNEEALRRTLETGRTWFWSRSRQEFWCKGETSGDRQWVRE